MPRLHPLKKALICGFVCTLTIIAQTVSAADVYQIGIDLDPGAIGGCDFDLMGAEPNPPDVDLLLELTVTAGSPPMVTSSLLSTCNQGLNLFENPTAVGTVPWPVGEGVGVPGPGGAGNVVEAVVPASALSGATHAQLFLYADSDSAIDVLTTTDGTPTGSSIMISLGVPAPLLSPFALVLLAALFLSTGWLLSRRWTHHAHLTLLLVALAIAPGVAWAMMITLDGSIADWASLVPVAVDADNDSTPSDPEAEILALFATAGGELSLRFDLSEAANIPPTVDSISLTPTLATEASTLTCAATGSDLDGDPVTFAYSWTVNGGSIGATTATLNGIDFNKSDSVVCTATPNDGTEDGLPANSNLVMIQNTPPTVASVSLTPLSATETTTFTCTPMGISDIDADAVTLSYGWLVNGAGIPPTTSTLTGTWFNKNDAVSCTVTPDDGFGPGATVTSNLVIVDNTPPSLGSVTLTPVSPTDSNTLTCSVGGIVDLDADAVFFFFAWNVNGSPIGQTTSTLGPAFSNVGDTVQCVATPDDGFTTGIPGFSNIETVQ